MDALTVEGLRKRYGRTVVLDGLHMAVPEGTVYGFLGRNGAGKTTTLRALAGVESADSGTLTFFGDAVRAPKPRHKQLVGYVSQSCHLYPEMTGKQLGRFVRGFFPTWDDPRFENLLTRFDVPPDRRVAALSGGTQVKLALALALAHHPRLLLLDEPTSGLDPAARREFLEIVAAESREHGHTTLFSSHIVEEVERVADHVGILVGGTLRWQGRVDDLRRGAVLVTPGAPTPGERLGIIHDRERTAWEVVLGGEASPQAPEPSLEDIFLAMARVA